MKTNKSKLLAFTSILTAVSASLCCITPILALIAGSSGFAASFSWLEPFRPWLIATTLLVLALAWYHKLKPQIKDEIECACDDDEKPSLLQSKRFLGFVTVFAAVMLSFPYYADSFFPETKLSKSVDRNLETNYQISIKGMTCTGCEEHIKVEIGKLPGITQLEVSYVNENAKVTFDESQTSIEEVKSAIGNTGYQVESVNKLK